MEKKKERKKQNIQEKIIIRSSACDAWCDFLLFLSFLHFIIKFPLPMLYVGNKCGEM